MPRPKLYRLDPIPGTLAHFVHDVLEVNCWTWGPGRTVLDVPSEVWGRLFQPGHTPAPIVTRTGQVVSLRHRVESSKGVPFPDDVLVLRAPDGRPVPILVPWAMLKEVSS